MKKRKFYICTTKSALVVVGLLLLELNIAAQTKPEAVEMNPEYADILTNTPPAGFATRLDYVRSYTNEKEVLNAFHAEKLNKGEAMIALFGLKDRVSMDTYGKVIDQEGQPVIGASVQGKVEVSGDFITHMTETDEQGRFKFLGLQGSGLIMHPKKEGYSYDGTLRSERPKNYLPDPSNPLVFTMWKLHGAEPMMYDKKFYGINPDGRIFTIDLVKKQKIEGTNAIGDLQVQLQRPIPIKRGEKFDWSFAVTAIGGGVIEATNAVYLNEAPESGYQPSYNVNMSAADQSWQKQIKKTFYFKSRDGKIYGRFRATIIPDYNDKSVFDVESFVNPAGSRNLEFDSKKQIR